MKTVGLLLVCALAATSVSDTEPKLAPPASSLPFPCPLASSLPPNSMLSPAAHVTLSTGPARTSSPRPALSLNGATPGFATAGFPTGKRLTGAPTPRTALRFLDGSVREGINFSSQDDLGLASHPDVKHAAHAAYVDEKINSAAA